MDRLVRFIPSAATSCLNHTLFMLSTFPEFQTGVFTGTFCQVSSDRVPIKLKDTSAHPEMQCNVARQKIRYTPERHRLESRLTACLGRRILKFLAQSLWSYMFLLIDWDPSNANPAHYLPCNLTRALKGPWRARMGPPERFPLFQRKSYRISPNSGPKFGRDHTS